MRTGEEFGPYTLLRRLAAGGMGEIWLAERRGSAGFSKRVVVKTILECFAEDPSLVEMFLDEGRIAANLNHPNIAQTYDLGQAGKGAAAPYYIAMEYVHGRDLRDLLVTNIDRKQFIPLNLVLRIVADVCQGLHHAHSWKTPEGEPAGIIHRDVSPQNILVTFDGVVKIVDFGVAKATERASKTRSGVLKGKYAYMSPEQVRSKKLDARADIFSVGVVMFELVTGRRLFKRDSETATLDAVISAVVPKPRRFDTSVPPEVEAILLKALSLRPGDRYQSARGMQLVVEELMMELQLPASSAHLTALMNEIYGGKEDEEKYAGRGSRSRSELMRKMESLPGVGDEAAPSLERTASFTGPKTEPSFREPTRDLRLKAKVIPKRKRPWLVPALVLLAVVVGLAGFFAVSYFVKETEPEKTEPPAEPVAAVELAIIPPKPEPAAQSAAPSTVPPSGGALEVLREPEIKTETESTTKTKTTPAKEIGFITVTTDPEADIYLGKKKLGRGSIRRVKVEVGKHKLKVAASKGSQKILTVRVKRGGHVTKNVIFRPGTLRVVVSPWADVWVDGEKKGQTPLAPIELLEGVHRVRLVNDQLDKDLKKKVRIRPGKESVVRLDWR